MAATGEVIQSFLVGLGFDVDESSLSAFNSAIQKAALRVTALYSSINAFAGSIVYAFAKISEGFEEMGYQYHIIAPAINKAIVLRNELMKAYGAAGINIRKVIVDSIRLNMSLTKTRFAMEAIYKSVGSKFFGLLQAQSDAFRKRLYQNMPYIIHALEKLVKVVFTAFAGITQLGGRLWSILSRVYDFFVDLDRVTNGWSTIIGGVIAAWKLLNLEFLATPLGALIAGFAGLLALWDDFKTFKEGGQSLINWAPLIPIIDNVSKSLVGLYDTLKDVIKLFSFGFGGNFIDQLVLVKKLATDISAIFVGMSNAIDNVVRLLGGETINKILDYRDKIEGSISNTGGKVLDWVSGSSSKPLGTNTSQSTTNVNAKFQTDVNVQGSPNANATAGAVASAQSGVNRDAVRHLKGATR